MMRRIASLTIVFLLTMGASIALAQNKTANAWIDQPLAWKIITEVPVQITAHLAHPDGVTNARLDVDGQAQQEVDLGGATLERASFEWVPPGSGTYLLEVRGRGGGEWGPPAVVEVTVVLGTPSPTSSTTSTAPQTSTTAASSTTTIRPTTTQATTTTTIATTSTTSTPSSTTTAAPTTTTTTTSCDLGVPRPTGATGTSTLTPAVEWSYDGCREPDQFELQVSRTSDFLRLEWSGSTTGNARTAEVSVGANCTTYFWRIRTYDSRSAGPWSAIAFFFVQTTRTCP